MTNKYNNNLHSSITFDYAVEVYKSQGNISDDEIIKHAKELLRILNNISNKTKRSNDKYYYNTVSIENIDNSNLNTSKAMDLEYLIKLCEMDDEDF